MVNVIVYQANFTQHPYHLQKVVDAIRAANLKIKFTKCYFASSSEDFLGRHVSKLSIESNKRNTDVVSTFPELVWVFVNFIDFSKIMLSQPHLCINSSKRIRNFCGQRIQVKVSESLMKQVFSRISLSGFCRIIYIIQRCQS